MPLSIEHIIKPSTHLIDYRWQQMKFLYSLRESNSFRLSKRAMLFSPRERNYWSLFLLPCFHKVCENFKKGRLQSLLNNNNIVCEHQYGFRKTYPTNLALIEAFDDIYSDLDNGLYSSYTCIPSKREGRQIQDGGTFLLQVSVLSKCVCLQTHVSALSKCVWMCLLADTCVCSV